MSTQILKETSLRDEQGRVIFQFGRFPTLVDGSDVDTPINWIMLSDKRSKDRHGKVLLLSEKILYCYWYDGDYKFKEVHQDDLVDYNKNLDDVWKNSDLHNWLNGENFLNKKQGDCQVFDDKERELIQDNDFGKVFCLSVYEIKKYLKTSLLRSCKSTDFAKAKHTTHGKEFKLYALSDGSDGDVPPFDLRYVGNSRYWTRSTGIYGKLVTYGTAAVVFAFGEVVSKGHRVDYGYGVRPAVWLNL